MSRAEHAPVIRTGKEISTSDLKVGQQPRIVLTADDEIDHENVIIPVDTPLMSEHARLLAFAEEPVTIRIAQSSEKFAPKVVDAWVNGKGAEVLMNGKWVELGWLPVNIPVTTRRKYVEILARSKTDALSTQVVKHEESEENNIDRNTSSKTVFSVIDDKSPLGVEWLTRLLMEG